MDDPPANASPRAIVLATRNPGKVREIRRTLADLPVEGLGLEGFEDIPEPEEHGDTFAANARDKALYYARATVRWCLAEDSGLVVDALGGAPGVRSARYAAGDCPPGADRETVDRANNARLLAELRDVPRERRTARFVCHVALADEQGILLETSDSVEGEIALEPRGSNGFGYDPLFYVPRMDRTTAELSSDEKNRISHRGKAVRKFAAMLRDLLERR